MQCGRRGWSVGPQGRLQPLAELQGDAIGVLEEQDADAQIEQIRGGKDNVGADVAEHLFVCCHVIHIERQVAQAGLALVMLGGWIAATVVKQLQASAVREANPELAGAMQPIRNLRGDPVRQAELVQFLKSLTDERVRKQTAPFDHPELIILDVLMPRMDGWGVIRELRSDPLYADLPIMVLTTVIEDASRRRYELEVGMEMDVQDYVQKPAKPAELLQRVEKLLKVHA